MGRSRHLTTAGQALRVHVEPDVIAHLDAIATLAGVSRAEVVRQLCRDSLDRARGVYSEWPDSAIAGEVEALIAATREDN